VKPSRFKSKTIPLIFIITILPVLFSCTTYVRFIKKFIARHTAQIGESEQLIFVTNRDSSSSVVTIHAVERNNGVWHLVFPTFTGSVGEKGFAAIVKRGRQIPSGVFLLGLLSGMILRWRQNALPAGDGG
jgi:L,D-peptidoglycan transpeptidase YkuD (ErfK/YbiS/YcfS/YnhG family)